MFLFKYAKLKKKKKRSLSSRLYNIYVIKLRKEALKKKKFLKENPNFDINKPLLYVGMSARTPEERFKQHKIGYKANRLVYNYGEKLMPSIYKKYSSLPYEKAKIMEHNVAEILRSKGHAVWQR